MCAYRSYLGIILFPLLLVACGLKASPVPRETVVPVPIEDIKLTRTSEGIKIEWTLPDRALDGSPLREIAGYRVVRQGPDGLSTRKEVWLPFSERQQKTGEKVFFIDTFPEQKGIYHFWVIPFDTYGSSPDQGKGIAVRWEG